MRILGIDPGFATLGYAFLDFDGVNMRNIVDYGCITTTKDIPFAERMSEIGRDFQELIALYQPSVMVIEEVYFSKNVKTAIKVAEARGVISYLAHSNNIECHDINPLQVKLNLTGDGKADKQQVQKMLQQSLQLAAIPSPDDAADALAIALSYSYIAHMAKMNGL